MMKETSDDEGELINEVTILEWDGTDAHPEMSPTEKQAMVDCVRRGDIEELEELLDIPGADINMVWFCENLLMTAIRWNQLEMALYLIDNDVDVLFETSRLEVITEIEELEQLEDPSSEHKIQLSWYMVSCRQMAYDRGLPDVVDAIDIESGELLLHTPTMRTKRFWKPKEIREQEKLELEADASFEIDTLLDGVEALGPPVEPKLCSSIAISQPAKVVKGKSVSPKKKTPVRFF